MNEEDYELADTDGSVSGQCYTYSILSNLKMLKIKSCLKTGINNCCYYYYYYYFIFQNWHLFHCKEKVWLISKCAANNVV